jgi:hypothetical protein
VTVGFIAVIRHMKFHVYKLSEVGRIAMFHLVLVVAAFALLRKFGVPTSRPEQVLLALCLVLSFPVGWLGWPIQLARVPFPHPAAFALAAATLVINSYVWGFVIVACRRFLAKRDQKRLLSAMAADSKTETPPSVPPQE